MPKPGYTGLTVKKEIAELLKSKAKQEGLGLNAFLLKLLQNSSRDCPGTVPHAYNGAYPLETFISTLKLSAGKLKDVRNFQLANSSRQT